MTLLVRHPVGGGCLPRTREGGRAAAGKRRRPTEATRSAASRRHIDQRGAGLALASSDDQRAGGGRGGIRRSRARTRGHPMADRLCAGGGRYFSSGGGAGGRDGLSIEGCHILARQFRERIEARDEKAAALVGQSRACPFDLHVLLPIPAEILQRGPTDQESLDWLARHWGTRDALRKIVARPNPSAGRRLPGGHVVVSYGFFTTGETPRAAVTQLVAHWPALRFVLTPLPAD